LRHSLQDHPRGHADEVAQLRVDWTDGELPHAALVRSTEVNLYGTTNFGGANSQGTVFKIRPNDKLQTLYSFCSQSNRPDGYQPYGERVQGTDGNFYGTTPFGGANLYFGAVFKITSSGVLITLYSFCSKTGCGDGDEPAAGLVQETNGEF
jgi:uncharacterized repeat protein (TIGR03803 family)